jgi:hypothetical protein
MKEKYGHIPYHLTSYSMNVARSHDHQPEDYRKNKATKQKMSLCEYNIV